MATDAVTEKARVLKTESAFVWAFAIGVAVIFLVKLIAQGRPILGGVVASALGIAIMGLYRHDQKGVRPEGDQPRLGDEVYYLGLLYTLTSLCAALVSLFLLFGGEQPLEERTDEMIGSFGIALLTTMAGIVMRMTLQGHGAGGQETIIRIPHSATDSGGAGVAIEGVTVDLERYAYELRRQLQNSANAFASHANQTILQARTTHAHMDEMMQAFHDGLQLKANADLESLTSVFKAVADRAEEASQRAAVQQEGIYGALESFQAQVRAMDESMGRIRAVSGETAQDLEAIGVKAKESAQAAQEWMGVQRQVSAALKELEQTIHEFAKLGHEAQRTNTELATLPGGLRKATIALEHLAEITTASNAISDLEANATAVTEHLAGIAGACKGHQEALDATVEKLQALAEIAGQRMEDQGRLKETLTELSEIAPTASRYTQGLKASEREIQRINSGLNGVQTALQEKGIELAEVLRTVIVDLEEVRRRDSGVFTRLFRR